MFTFPIWQDNTKIYRFIALPVSGLWIAYNIHYNSAFGLIAEIILLFFEVIGIVRNDIIKKSKKEGDEYESISCW